MAKAKLTMDELLAGANESVKRAIVGETVTGKILSMKKHEILIDLGARGVGIVPRREVSFARNLNVGDEVSASVIEAEMGDGSVLLSLRKAAKEKVGMRSKGNWTQKKLSRLRRLMQIVEVCWRNTKESGDSCRCRNFRQNITHGLVVQTRTKSCRG